MAGSQTLVYSPEVRILIEGTDVSRDFVRGSVSRITGGVSSVQFSLSNKGLRYNNRFRRMDRVSIQLKRVKWVQVFAGYLDLVPGLQLYPHTVTFKASCTIKRILYTLWDPGLSASMELLNQRRTQWGQYGSGGSAPVTGTDGSSDDATDGDPDAAPTDAGDNPGSAAPVSDTVDPTIVRKDSGIGDILRNVLTKVGGWDDDQVNIQEFPESFLGYVKEQMPDLQGFTEEAREAFKEMFDFYESTGSSASSPAGGGGLGDATFTSIGPPANGSAYSDDELVWIVKNGGWTGDDVAIGVAIIKAESGGNPGAVNVANGDGSVDRGLWQINSVHDGTLPGQNRFDPAVSTQLARGIYRDAGGWTPWSTFSYHGTYSQHMDAARAAVSRGGTAPPNSGTSAPSGPVQGPGIPGNPGTPGTNPGGPTPTAPSGPYGLPRGTNVSYGAQGFPDWVYSLAQQFNLQASTYPGHQEDHRNEAGYAPNPERQNRGIDWSGAVPDMHRFAEYLFGIAPNTPALEQIIWQNPSTGQRIGWAGRSPDSNGSYFAGDYGGHQDHVHTRQSAALDGSGSMTGAAPGMGGGSTFENKLAKNIFTFLFDPTIYADELSGQLVGKYASLNDQSLIEIVRALCEARMCEFQSSPDGEFVAFYPDYFGLDGTAPALKLEDIECKDIRININDDALTTHVFTRGANTMEGTLSATGDLGYIESPGVVTVEDEWLFKRATEGAYFTPEFDNAEDLLRRFGPRRIKKQYPNVYQDGAPESMLLIAIKLFMQKWAEQYQTQIELTFMPEIFPGMRIELVGHDLVVYVKSVTHNMDFESGFTTSVQVMAPMSVSRSPLGRSSSTGAGEN